jgi:hypothetical protein
MKSLAGMAKEEGKIEINGGYFIPTIDQFSIFVKQVIQ